MVRPKSSDLNSTTFYRVPHPKLARLTRILYACTTLHKGRGGVSYSSTSPTVETTPYSVLYRKLAAFKSLFTATRTYIILFSRLTIPGSWLTSRSWAGVATFTQHTHSQTTGFSGDLQTVNSRAVNLLRAPGHR